MVAALRPLHQEHFEPGASLAHDHHGGRLAWHGCSHDPASAVLKRIVFTYMNKRYMYVYTRVKGRFPTTGEAPALVQ